MFPPKAFNALVELVEAAAKRNVVDGVAEEVFEPLDHIEPGLPRTLIHVSGSEVLVSDARKAAHAGRHRRIHTCRQSLLRGARASGFGGSDDREAQPRNPRPRA